MNLSRLFASNLVWRGTYLFTSLLVTIFLSRYLQAYAMGWLFYFISILTFLFMALSFGIDSAITYLVAKGEIDTGRMQVFIWCWVLLVSILTAAGAVFYFQEGNEWASATQLAGMTVLFVSGNLIITFYNALFYSKHEYKLPNVVFIVVNIFLLLLLLMPQWFQLSASRFIFLYFCLYLLQGLVVVLLFNLTFSHRYLLQFPTKEQRQQLFRYSHLAFFAGLLFYLVTRIDYWFIDYFTHDTVALGNYIQASRLVQLFQLLPAVLAAGIFPIAASGYVQQMREGILKLSRVIVLLYFVLLSLLAATGQWLFPFLFGSSFSKMYHIFLLLIPGLMALSLLALMAAYFAAVNQVRRNLVISVTGLVMIVVADVLLIPRFGIYGAAVASSIGYLACFIIAYIYFAGDGSISVRDVMVFKKQDIKFLAGLAGKIQSADVKNEKD
ncbi:MAG TPA: polysaccharide biosynthesis C-terminal domain-containing protein [Lacibacter sp.]|nr:polysaccharide biosynthesis C-terminal domain-containing protein [Lacibacter sp.]